MSKYEFYVCHAGQGIDQYVPEFDNKGVGALGVIGCLYVWKGVYVRSPDECANNDKMEILELESMADGTLCWGSLDSFTPIDSNIWLEQWIDDKDAVNSVHPHVAIEMRNQLNT